jgi:hypothetical protein
VTQQYSYTGDIMTTQTTQLTWQWKLFLFCPLHYFPPFLLSSSFTSSSSYTFLPLTHSHSLIYRHQCFKPPVSSTHMISQRPRSFRHVRKIVKSDYEFHHVCLSVCPSVHVHGTTWLPMDRFSWNLVMSIFPKSVQRIQVSLKYDNNNRYFTWRPMQIFYHILLTS